MVVSYKRDMNRNFMVIEGVEEKDYQIKMLCANRIKGLLAAKTNVFNGKKNLYFDISSKQPLSRLYAKKELEMEDIKSILFSLQSVIAETRKYLLDSNEIVYDPNYCYCNPDSSKPEWTFIPGGSDSGHLNVLAEFFIEKVNHQDGEAVETVYRFFREVKEGNFILSDLIDSFTQCKDEPSNRDEGKDIISELYVPDEMPEPIRENGFFEKLKQQLAAKLHPVKTVSVQRKEMPRYSSQGYERDCFEAEREVGCETVVMGVRENGSKRQLRSMDNSAKIISLEMLPCVIGKRKECADIILEDGSISRIHAKIYEDRDEIYLQDLNSTNGTYINGLALENNEIVKLKKGDEVAFGNLRYIYE